MGRVAVIHPDLGVGGAERLIVDVCKALKDCHHRVVLYTGYHNVDRCFEETRDGTIKTIPVGQWIPRSIFGKFHALLAYLKMIYIAFYIMLWSSHDVIICDQVSACIPFLKLDIRNKAKIIFYCHFPDQLLTRRETLAKTIYRKPLDTFEEWSTSLADQILVNSRFTQKIVKQTFKSLKNRELTVLHPCVDVKSFVERKPRDQDCDKLYEQNVLLSKDNFTFLSLNRFERKKSLETAIVALSKCHLNLTRDIDTSTIDKKNKKKLNTIHLIVAGGYDPRLDDCVAYYNELVHLTKDLKLELNVTFIKSPSDDDKLKLLQICDAVVYTPENEHFGIVPLEAMAMSKPVIASASGGPLETVLDEVNGYLCSTDDDDAFWVAMLKLYSNQDRCVDMGKNGFEHVKKLFSYEVFCHNLNEICFPRRRED